MPCLAESKGKVTIVSLFGDTMVQLKINRSIGQFIGTTMLAYAHNIHVSDASVKRDAKFIVMDGDFDQEIEKTLVKFYSDKGEYIPDTSVQSKNSVKEIKRIATKYRKRNPCKNKIFKKNILSVIKSSGSDKIVFVMPDRNSFTLGAAGGVKLYGFGALYDVTGRGSTYSYGSANVCAIDVKTGANIGKINVATRKEIELPRPLNDKVKKAIVRFLVKEYGEVQSKTLNSLAPYKSLYSDIEIYEPQKSKILSQYESDFSEEEESLRKLEILLNQPHHQYGEYNTLPKLERLKVYNHIVSTVTTELQDEIPILDLNYSPELDF